MNSDEFRGDVRILFGDPGQGTRVLYRQALMAAGYHDLREFDSVKGFADLITVARPDLVFMDLAMPEGDAVALVSDLRHGRLGVNPYLPIILTSWESDMQLVRRVVDAGADDLLVKPLSTRIILDRIETVALHRKPFVVTSDYIGPDRRKAVARRDSNVPLIEVPNPLREKMLGRPIDAAALQQAIMAANDSITRQRLHASAFRIAFVAAQVVPRYKDGERPDTATLTLLADLIVSAEDIRLRVADSEFSHVVQVCDRLLAQARPLAELDVDFTLSASWVKSLDLVKSLADALLALFNPERDASALAGEVANAVDRFRNRRAAQQTGELPAV
ncbi:response regulator [Ferrovibrio xuzhouensis]|uniref:PleD family two-component system response regulator n=1 Tax=Ferrovibrio xuzhouensis TaxID=1576914 RepID=A0ABV7VMR8_9PROT